MTILTTPSVQKPILDSCEVKVENGDEEEKAMMNLMSRELEADVSSRRLTAILCMAIIAMAAAGAGILFGIGFYRGYVKSTFMRRYQSFCTIPVDIIDDRDDERQMNPHFNMMPLPWSSDPDVQVFSTAEENSSDDFIRSLREELDIVDDTVEKISVFNGPNGRQTSYIHDFSANVSGIVDGERCFVMELDRSLVLPPSVFVLTIEGNGEFEVSRVRGAMRALLPPLVAPLLPPTPDLALRCRGKPVYSLLKQEGVTIRKRSADGAAAPSDFTHFAGRHVQEIDVTNMAELLAYENTNKDA